jgi:hypothetical protein
MPRVSPALPRPFAREDGRDANGPGRPRQAASSLAIDAPEKQLECLENQIADLDIRIQDRMCQYQKAVDLCTTVPGIEAVEWPFSLAVAMPTTVSAGSSPWMAG